MRSQLVLAQMRAIALNFYPREREEPSDHVRQHPNLPSNPPRDASMMREQGAKAPIVCSPMTTTLTLIAHRRLTRPRRRRVRRAEARRETARQGQVWEEL
jgi:hypothetical protein